MSRGRPREFDEAAALDAAMEVFWRKGYGGTSLADLTGAMGINKPSLYAAFGNKEALFVSALTQYVGRHGVPHMQRLQDPGKSLRERVRDYLKSVATMLFDPRLPGGCLVASSTCELGSDCLPSGVSRAIEETNESTRSTLVDFFQAEAALGTLASPRSPQALADHLLALQYGLAVMARDGASHATLGEVIEQAASTF